MSTVLLTIYFLMWPVIVAGVLFVITRAFLKDWRVSRSKGHDII